MLASVTVTSFAATTFDGILRKTEEGRYDALLPPPFESNHASFIERDTPNDGNNFAMAWFSGTKEGESDVAIVIARLDLPDGIAGGKWSNATVVSQRPNFSNQNPVLFHDAAEDELHLFHTQQSPESGEKEATVWYLKEQPDKTFSEPVKIFGKDGSFIRNRMIKSLNGTWLFPMY